MFLAYYFLKVGTSHHFSQGFGSSIFLIADPDPDPGFDDLTLKKIYSCKFNFYFLDQKLQFT
jgi:hypothetical protein